jgi:recombination protein RecR
MDFTQFPSKVFEEAVNQFATLPGVGKKTALRLTLFLLRQEKEELLKFGNAFVELADQIQYCKKCHNISDKEVCDICSNVKRDQQTICVVENIQDVLAIESTQQFNGLYHVLGGLISPMDGIGPNDLSINPLLERINKEEINEIIFALSATMEGDTTNFYIYRKLTNDNLKISIIARGVSIGDELEYTDEITLGRSIVNRTNFETTLPKQ